MVNLLVANNNNLENLCILLKKKVIQEFTFLTYLCYCNIIK